MPNTKNKEIVAGLKDKLENAKSIVFMDYMGLDANKLGELRKQIRADGAELSIAKNTLMKLALSERKKEKVSPKLIEQLKGQTMTLLSYEDAVAPLKRIVEFAKTYNTPAIKMGIFDGKEISEKEVSELSKLPSRDELIAQVVYGLRAPLTGIVSVLGGTQRKFVYALSAIAEKRSGLIQADTGQS